MTKTRNEDMNRAKKEKNDEFYTRIEDIEKEMKNYREHFKGKHIFLNCDDPEKSEFWQYFSLNFDKLGLRKLTATHFEQHKPSYKLEIHTDINGDGKVDHKDMVKTPLKQNGDFRSPEALEILEDADIVITNPPFSLFRDFVDQLLEHNKKFIILGNNNAITYKNVFTAIKDEKMWLGTKSNQSMEFMLHEDYPSWKRVDEHGNKFGTVPAISWFTNLEHNRRKEKLVLHDKYTPEKYPTYDNYDAIEVGKVSDIPVDYDGFMGVPITFLGKHNPDQFEICGLDDHTVEWRGKGPNINGKTKYRRIIIQRKGNK